jgi:beta-lactamase superfamily II metal-dependent hydrolase
MNLEDNSINEVKIHFLNVKHGDSIIIEIYSEKRYIIVIDTNCVKENGEYVCPALNLLKSIHAGNIDLLIISHFDSDHFFGVERLFAEFKIDKLCIPNLFDFKPKILKRIKETWKERIKSIAIRTWDNDINEKLYSELKLFEYIFKNRSKIQMLMGADSILRIAGLNNFEGHILLPVQKIKRDFFNSLMNEGENIMEYSENNDSSLAISFEFFGKKILFSGDSTTSQWNYHKRYMKRDKIYNLCHSYLKAAHHGSKYNNNKNLYNYLLKKDEEVKSIFISANGNSHPHWEIFKLIKLFRLHPYCTNISKYCVKEEKIPELDPKSETTPFLRHLTNDSDYPSCQGNITLILTPEKQLIQTSNNTFCPYRR